jgi:hypothetical protein
MVVLVIGIVMLVPGFCVIAFLVDDGFGHLTVPIVAFLCLIGLLVSALGICLISLVSRGRR